MTDTLESYRGDVLIYDFQVLTQTGGTVDLLGSTLRFTARTHGGSAAVTALSGTAIAGTGIEIINPPTAGSATLTVGTAATVNLSAPQRLEYDIEVTESDGRRSTFADAWYLRADVTT